MLEGTGEKSMEIDRSIKWKRTCELRRIIEERKNYRELWKKEIGSIQFFLENSLRGGIYRGKMISKFLKIFLKRKRESERLDALRFQLVQRKLSNLCLWTRRPLFTDAINFNWVALFFSVSIRNPIHIWRRYISIFF